MSSRAPFGRRTISKSVRLTPEADAALKQRAHATGKKEGEILALIVERNLLGLDTVESIERDKLHLVLGLNTKSSDKATPDSEG